MRVSKILAACLAAAALAVPLALAAPPAVKFPTVSTPAPMPSAVATLTADRLFVVESKDEVALKASTIDGLVDVKAVPGPFTVYAKFADGPDKLEFRTFAGPYVFLLTPAKTGKCELFVTPKKWETPDDIITRTIQVEVGDGPKPPPGPGPNPQPQPPPDPDVRKDVSYRVVFVEETSTAAAGRGAMFTNKALDARMREKGHNFRVVDKDVVDKDGKVPADLVDLLKLTAAKSYPQVFLVDKAGKLKTLQFDAPADAAGLVKLLTDNGG